MTYRKSGLTGKEQKQFVDLLSELLLKVPTRGLKETVLLRELDKYPRILKKYQAHSEQFDISNQERRAIFEGQIGVCENPECGNYTKWKRPRYLRFCSKKCSGPFTVEGRRQTCLERYGVPHTSKVPEIRGKMSKGLKEHYESIGKSAPRSKKFEYTPKEVLPNTGTGFYVYVLLDPRKPGEFRYGKWKFDHEPFYVGKGKGLRAYDHLLEHNLKSVPNRHKKNKIAAIVKAGLEPIVLLKKRNLDEASAFEQEARLIHTIGYGKFGPLTNAGYSHEGGVAGYKHSKKTRKVLSDISKTHWAKLTDDERDKRSSSAKPFDVKGYKEFLAATFRDRIKVVFKEKRPRKSFKAEHRCVCGHVWNASPTYVLFHSIGCRVCKNDGHV